MWRIGGFPAQTCGGVSRRGFLNAAAAAPWVLPALASGTPAWASGETRAKSVILLWLWGAPSHLDTFDPKPHAPREYRGPFAPIATQTPGVSFTELLPRLAERSDRFALVRSMVSSEPGHPDAGTVGLTGFKEKPDPVRPSFGSIAARHAGLSRRLPPFVSVGRGIPRDVVRILEGYGGGTLGKAYDPFPVSCAADGTVEIPSLSLLDGLNPLRIQDRRLLLDHLDGDRRRLDKAGYGTWERNFQGAYQLLTDPVARAAFDLTRESEQSRAAYGATTFGQSCLLARRLAEADVPFIQVNWSQYVEAITPQCDFGWDTHIYNFEMHQDRLCPILDRALSALLDDLQQRGMLHNTLVVAMGEFGRTPRINGRASRDHWPQCYFSLWAGAGLPGGRVIGSSDRLGEHPTEAAVTPLMAGTTIAELSGINTQIRAELKVLDGGSVIEGLL